ncbi:MAG TPA: S53 family serine peptidase [Rhizomicrobium sp.]
MTRPGKFLAMALPAAMLLASTGAFAATGDIFGRIAAPAGVTQTAMPDAAPMHVILSLPLSDAAGAAQFGASVSDPDSPTYGHYLTPAQFAARFGASKSDYQTLRNWAKANGLQLGARTSSRTTVSLTGTAGQFASLFNTRFASFHTDAHGDGYVMLKEPQLPAILTGKIDGVIGLESAGNHAWLAHPGKKGLNPVGSGIDGYAPTDIRTAYDIPAQTNSNKTEVLALFEESGFPANDMTVYYNEYKLTSVPITLIGVNGSGTGSGGATVETDLDLQASIGANPNLSQILMYIDENGSFSSQLVDSFNQIAQDDQATVLSVSYGLDENQQGETAVKAENTALTQLQAEGITVFVSSGDDGAAGREGTGLNAPDPGSQPLITSVGGTRLNVTSKEAWSSETVWNDLSQGDGATGGGVSKFWDIPKYQLLKGKSVAVANGGSKTMRNVPDVAADADPFTPYSEYCGCFGGWFGDGGTSLSAPIWAGMATVINSNRVNAGLPRLGFFNTALYKIAKKEKKFHDITQGNNGSPGYTAGPGYDNDTGFGSVDLNALMPKLLKK